MTTSASAPFFVDGFLTIDKTTLIFAPGATEFLTSAASGLAQPNPPAAAVYWGYYDDEHEGYIGWKVWAGGHAAEFIFPEAAFPFLAEVINKGGPVQFTAAAYADAQALATTEPVRVEQLQQAMEPSLTLADAHLTAVPTFLQTVGETRLEHPVVTKKILRAFGR